MLGSGSEVPITVSLIEMKKGIFIDRNECEMLRFHNLNNNFFFLNRIISFDRFAANSRNVQSTAQFAEKSYRFTPRVA